MDDHTKARREISAHLIKQAEELRVDWVETAERAVRDRMASKRWQKTHARDIETYNDYIREHGLPLEEYRLF